MKRTGQPKKVSDKRKKVESGRRKFVAEQLTNRPVCEAGKPIMVTDNRHRCHYNAVDVHEPLTRARGGSITDINNSVTVCRACHDWIHANPAKANKLRLLLHAWETE